MAHHADTHPTLDVPDCFGCKAASVSLTFRYSRETFHDTTIGESVREAKRYAEARGTEIESTTRWV